MKSMPVKLMLVTDLAVADERATCAKIESALSAARPGEVVVGLRDHAASIARRWAFGRALVATVRKGGGRIAVHDRIDLALAIGADGVHLGSRSVAARDARELLGQGAWIGRSCHDEKELARAWEERVDVATLSPLFESPGKGTPLGEARFAAMRARFPEVRVLALGGIDRSCVRVARRAGADGVAVVRALLGAEDPAAVVRGLIAEF